MNKINDGSLLLAGNAFNVLDKVSTFVGVGFFGLREANPFISGPALVMSGWAGVRGGLFLSLLFSGFVGWLLLSYYGGILGNPSLWRRHQLVRRVTLFFAVMFLLVSMNNVFFISLAVF